MIAFILGFRSPKTTRQTIAYLIPILGFAAAFIVISDEMNYGARFQYALVPVALISWTLLVRGLSFSKQDQLSARERGVYFIALIGLSAEVWFIIRGIKIVS